MKLNVKSYDEQQDKLVCYICKLELKAGDKACSLSVDGIIGSIAKKEDELFHNGVAMYPEFTVDPALDTHSNIYYFHTKCFAITAGEEWFE